MYRGHARWGSKGLCWRSYMDQLIENDDMQSSSGRNTSNRPLEQHSRPSNSHVIILLLLGLLNDYHVVLVFVLHVLILLHYFEVGFSLRLLSCEVELFERRSCSCGRLVGRFGSMRRRARILGCACSWIFKGIFDNFSLTTASDVSMGIDRVLKILTVKVFQQTVKKLAPVDDLALVVWLAVDS